MLMYQTKSLRQNEGGFASLVVGLVLVLVLALLTVGFAQLTRHEQQQALGNELATQAYYAAESGINDTIKGIEDNSPSIVSNANVNSGQCLNPPTVLSFANDVSYTCVLLNLKTPDIEYTNIAVGGSESIVVSTNAALSSLNIDWGSSDGHNSYNTPYPKFTQTANWNTGGTNPIDYPGVLQFSITPLYSLNRTSLINNTYTIYAYPNNANPPTVDYSTATANQGAVYSGVCNSTNTPYACSVTIHNLPAAGGPYLIHFLNFYDKSKVDITGKTGAGPTLASAVFSGGQAQIDVTGKAQDVLKRLQVRVPLNSIGNLPNYAIEAQNICKRMETQPGTTTFIDPGGGSATSGPCLLTTVSTSGGSAAVTTGGTCNDTCTGPPGTGTYDTYHWNPRLNNASPSGEASEIIGCQWDFGDGAKNDITGTVGPPNTLVQDACLPGDFYKHTYAIPSTFPTTGYNSKLCGSITEYVTLTLYLNNGTSVPSLKQPVKIPVCYNG